MGARQLILPVGGERCGGDPEDAAGQPTAVPATARPGVDKGRLPRRSVRQRSTSAGTSLVGLPPDFSVHTS